MSGVAERVAAGAAYLDDREPGWWERIDMDRLDMSAECLCVLGQLATDLETPLWAAIVMSFGLRRYRSFLVFDGDQDRPSDWAMGFNADPGWDADDQNLEYAQLEAEWKRVITERRAAS